MSRALNRLKWPENEGDHSLHLLHRLRIKTTISLPLCELRTCRGKLLRRKKMSSVDRQLVTELQGNT